MRFEYFQMIDRVVALDVRRALGSSHLHGTENFHRFRRPLSELSADAGRAAA